MSFVVQQSVQHLVPHNQLVLHVVSGQDNPGSLSGAGPQADLFAVPVEKTETLGTTYHSICDGSPRRPEHSSVFCHHSMNCGGADMSWAFSGSGADGARASHAAIETSRPRQNNGAPWMRPALGSALRAVRDDCGMGSPMPENTKARHVGAGFRLEFASRSALIHLRHRAISRGFHGRPLVLRPRIAPGVLLSGGSCLARTTPF